MAGEHGHARPRLPALLERLADAAALPEDDQETRTRKASLILLALVIIPLTPVWVITYWLLGLILPGAIPLGYAVVSTMTLVIFLRTKRLALFRASQLFLMLLLPFLLQWSLGGFVASSAVAVWAFTSPMGALAFHGARQALPWFLGYLVLIIVSAVADPYLTSRAGEIPEPIRLAFFAANIVGVSLVTYLVLRYFMRGRERVMAALEREHRLLQKEQDKSERLLLNVLPKRIADRLKETDGIIAEGFDQATVLFADIVDFTPHTERTQPEEVVEALDGLFSAFDELVAERGLEKIKTIGDAYMVAGGLPEPRPDHAEAVADMALAMRDEAARRVWQGRPLVVRIGIDSGRVVAGVIGRRKFIYDLWGDVVNTASRMESHGVPGCIQVSDRVFHQLKQVFEFEPRGMIEVKGKGTLPAYLLLGRRPTPAVPAVPPG
jgi:adenylate cyclase